MHLDNLEFFKPKSLEIGKKLRTFILFAISLKVSVAAKS